MIDIKTRIFNVLIIASLSLVLGWIYYRNLIWVVMIFLLLEMIQLILPKMIKKRPGDMMAFKMLLNGIYTELLIGKSFRNALIESRQHMSFEDPKFLSEVDLLIKDIQFQNKEILAWEKFSQSIRLLPCEQFVEVLKVTYDYGGQVTRVLKHTIKGLTDQMDLEMEIDIIISSKRYEFLLMICIPIALLLLLSYSQYEYMAVLYETLLGRIIMSFGLVTQIIAYILGRHIIEIEA